MLRQPETLPHTRAPHMHDHLEIRRCRIHPRLRQPHPLLLRQHIPLARRTVDKDPAESVFGQHRRISRNRLEIHIPVRPERRERRIDKPLDFFHLVSNIVDCKK